MRYLIPGLLLTASLTACGGGGDDAAEPAETVTVTQTVGAAEPTESATSEPAADGVLELGDKAEGNNVTAEVIKFDENTPVDPNIADQARWASALVKVCATGDKNDDGSPLAVSWYPWTVSDGGGGSYNVTGVTGGVVYPLPTYPQDQPMRLAVDQCVKGWITFNVAFDAKITEVVYANGGDTPIRWAI